MNTSTAGPADSLLAADFDEVRARFGAPVGCTTGGGVLTFAYPGPQGVIPDAVVVVDGIVVRVARGIRCAPASAGLPSLVGAHAEAAVARFGPLLRVVANRAGSELEFATAVVTVRDDCVVAVRECAPALTAVR